MSEASATGSAPDATQWPQAEHAGAVIRAARLARGQTLLRLSMLLKISERRLHAFEEGRWTDVGDRTFVRALALSLCKHLGLDAQPVLLSLPAAVVAPQSPADRGPLGEATAPSLNASGKELALQAGGGLAQAFTPVRVGVGLILAGALALALVPGDWWALPPKSVPLKSQPAAAPVSADAAADASASPQVNPPVATSSVTAGGTSVSTAEPALPAQGAATAAPVPPPAPPATLGAAAAAPRLSQAAPGSHRPGVDTHSPALELKAAEDTWVQVTDAQGAVLLSRLMRAGERLGVEGAHPLRLRVGNVAGTEATWRGRRVALDEAQRSNVADVELP